MRKVVVENDIKILDIYFSKKFPPTHTVKTIRIKGRNKNSTIKTTGFNSFPLL